MQQVIEGTDNVYSLAKKYHLKTAFGTDILFSAAAAEQQGNWLTRLTRWYTPAEALIMATSTNAELLSLSGLRNPYPGKLGVVEEGALADLLLVDGNPLENLDLVGDPAQEFQSHHEGREDLQEHRELTSTFWCCRLWHLADLDAGAELVRSRQLRRCVDEADVKTWRCPA